MNYQIEEFESFLLSKCIISINMHDVYPVKYYKDEGFVEHKVEIVEEDLEEILESYLRSHLDVNFDEIEIVNKREIRTWLQVKCRTYVDESEEGSDDNPIYEAEVQISGQYDGNP